VGNVYVGDAYSDPMGSLEKARMASLANALSDFIVLCTGKTRIEIGTVSIISGTNIEGTTTTLSEYRIIVVDGWGEIRSRSAEFCQTDSQKDKLVLRATIQVPKSECDRLKSVDPKEQKIQETLERLRQPEEKELPFPDYLTR
jgi:hypothetical protein